MEPRGVGVVAVEHDRGRKPVLLKAGWSQVEGANGDARELRALAHRLGASRTKANLVLADGEYQLLLVEAPRVEPAELRAAVRWQVKDLIDFHVDDAVIDVFEIPGQQSRPQAQAMMYAVVARARDVRERIDLVEEAELNLEAIDITEMALRNLASLLDDDVRGTATLYFGSDYGVITLTRQGNLYLSRRLDMGTEALEHGQTELLDQIVLEVQRSLDYYDSHFSQPPLTSLSVLPGFDGDEELVHGLDDALGLKVERFDPEQVFDCRTELDRDRLGPLLVAAGGALRREEISL